MSNRKIFVSLLAVAALTLAGIGTGGYEACAAGSGMSGMAPLSPEFLKWREDQAKILAAGDGMAFSAMRCKFH